MTYLCGKMSLEQRRMTSKFILLDIMDQTLQIQNGYVVSRAHIVSLVIHIYFVFIVSNVIVTLLGLFAL
jgi:hypothetical protein